MILSVIGYLSILYRFAVNCEDGILHIQKEVRALAESLSSREILPTKVANLMIGLTLY